MRELTFNEIHSIAGGFNCLDADMWKKVERKASSDAMIITLIAATLTGAATLGLTANPATAAKATLFVAPYAYIFGYQKSSAWNLFSFNEPVVVK